MKKMIIVSSVLLMGSLSFAQFQRQPVSNQKVLVNTVKPGMKTIVTGPYNPSVVLAVGGGKNVRYEMVRDIRGMAADDSYRSNRRNTGPSASSNIQWNCVTNNVSFSAESKSFMNASKNLSSFTIGSIYRFEDFFSGNYNEVVGGRQPITLYTENIRSAGPVVQTVSDPRGSSITNALRNMVQPFTNDRGSAQLIYRTFTSENEADLKMKITAGGSYGSFQANASFDMNVYSKHVYLTFDVLKPMFRVVAEKPDQGFFVDPAVAANNPNYVYVKEVQYGTRVLVNLDILIESREDMAKISASYGVGDSTKKSFSASMDVISKLKSAKTTVNAYIVGAPQTVTLLHKDKLEEEITALVATCNYGTAEPIIYKLADMSGNTIGVKSVTDEFTYQDCTPAASIYMLQSAKISIQNGDDNKEGLSTFAVELLKNTGNNQNVMLMNSSRDLHKGEIPVNQTEDFFLEGRNTWPAGYENVMNLNTFSNGGQFNVYYMPNFGLDAWKISSMTLTLFFKDQNNTTITRVVRFTNIEKLLNSTNKTLQCNFTGNFENAGVFLLQ